MKTGKTEKLSAVLKRTIAPATRGFLEFHLRRARAFDPYFGPMNGQTARLEIVREIITELGIARIVETGTFRGVTTQWFAQFGVPVLGIEINKRYATFTKLRLRNRPNVEIRRGNSAAILRDIVSRGDWSNERVLFYLDAHWGNELPLREEIEIVMQHFRQAVVIVDDFAVPGDPDYIFDDYGPGKRLDLNLLRAAKTPPLSIFFPAVSAQRETGMRTGCVVFTGDSAIAGKLATFPLLRRWAEDASEPSCSSDR